MQLLSEVQVGQAGTQRNRQQTPSAPTAVSKPRTGADVVRALREARARQQEATAASVKTEEAKAKQEELIETVSSYLEADAVLTIELAELNRTRGRHPKGSVQAEETRNLIDQRTDDQAIVRKELETIKSENHSAYDEGKRRYNFRQEALEVAESNRRLIGSASAADIRGRISGAIEANLMVELTTDQKTDAEENGQPVCSFDKKHYGSPWPNDPSVSDVTVSSKELLEDLQNRNDDREQAIIAELVRGGFYVSTRRDPDPSRKGETLPSELDLIRDTIKDEVKRTTGEYREWRAGEFLAGKGRRYVVHVGRGFVVLEHRDGKFFAVKTSDTRAGRALFTVPDRASDARMARKSAPEINNSGTTVTASDLSGVWYDPLRQGLEEDLGRETESAQRRKTADDLRDISRLENPLTLSGVAEGGIGIGPVSISYQDPETNRRHTVTFQVTGNGTTFSVTGTVPGTETVIKRVKRDRVTRKVVSSKPFLTDFIGKETPLAVLETDPVWREVVRPLNYAFERDWQLEREAKQRNAVSVTNENLDGLTAVEGQDGRYAVPATIRDNRGTKKDPKYTYKSVGYIFERKGSKMEIDWAVPGTSVSFASELRGEFEISNLPWRMKLILGKVFWVIRKTDAPEHLRLAKRSETDGTATEK